MKDRNHRSSSPKTAPASTPASARRWLWRVVAMVGSPLLTLVLLEAILRLAGFGYPTHFLLSWSEQGRKLLVQNNQFGWRFFGARMSRQPHPIALPNPKGSGTIRIFVLGESAAYGDPQPAFGLPRMLEAMLELRHPGVKFEVVNAAMTGINSHVIVPIARDCAGAEGDIWVIYMGNNEVVGPFGAGTVFGPQAPALSLVRASVALKATRVGQGLDAIRQRFGKAPLEQSEWGGMLMFLGHNVAMDDPRLDRVYHHFERNLTDLLRTARRAGAGVVLSTVAVNLRDFAPFASMHRAGLSETQRQDWEERFHAGEAAQSARNWLSAQSNFQAAAQIDDRFADLRFRLGQCAMNLGDTARAGREFNAARDLDALRFRCDSVLNQIIRQTATNAEGRSEVLMADAESAAATASPAGLPGHELFYEHVHLTFEGNFIIARAIAEKVELLLGRKLAAAAKPWPERADCARRLAWNDRARQMAYTEMLGRLTEPPFTLESNHQEQQRQMMELARTIPPADSPVSLREAQASCEAAVASWPADPLVYHQLAQIYAEQKQFRAAEESARRSLDLLPSNQQCWLDLGMARAQQKNYAEAAAAFQKVFDWDPDDVWGRQNLAICLQKLGQTDEAIAQFKRALALKPKFGLAWLGLGQLFEELGRNAEAQQCFQRALTNRIHRAQELTTLARFCQSRGWYEAAVTNYADAIALSPMDAGLRLEAGTALAALGKHAEAAQRYAEAVQIAPDLGQAHFLRGLELGKLSKPAEAEPEFRAAAQLMPEVAEARLNLAIALYQQRKLEQALDQFEQVARQCPTNALALKYIAALQNSRSAR